MWKLARMSYVLLAAAFSLCSPLRAWAQDAVTTIDIGQKTGAAPAHFDLLPAGEAGRGRWTVIQDATAAAGFAIERDGALGAVDHSFAIYKAASLKNADISLRLKTTGGAEDQGGGLAVRLMTPDNYYLIQLDARRDRVLFSRITNGVSEEIVGIDADVASNAWHTLAVRAVEDEFVVSLDGIWVFTGFDKTFPHAGRIALWTGTDSITRFDSITITRLSAAEERY
ncbi:MAG: hypothetical protein JWP25_114 [Bradyrhizobium sp.]|nr:hypothetical protein [Bradyrhizobium sp.]MEA2867288.1 hypothetical protein [Bradyrhizobium sp.]